VYDRELLLANGTDGNARPTRRRSAGGFRPEPGRNAEARDPVRSQKFFPARIADETASNAEDVVVRRVLDKLAQDHPARNTVFSTARADVAASEAFLAAHPVVVLPEPATLRVVADAGLHGGLLGRES
jgi:hypothetical protein